MNLDNLESHRDTLLHAEVGMLIHDLGKLSEEFINETCENSKSSSKYWKHHALIVEYDVKNGIGEAKTAQDILATCRMESDISILDVVKSHHEKNWNNKDEDYSIDGPSFIIKLLCASDKLDSEEDKGNVSQEGKQSISDVRISNPFGYEEHRVQISCLETQRREIYKILSLELSPSWDPLNSDKRCRLLENMKELLNQSLGETRRAANDVTIWQHSYMAASMLKALLRHYYASSDFKEFVDSINGDYDTEQKWKWKRNNKEFNIEDIVRENNPFRVLSIHWDFFAFLTQSQKICDIKGRIEILNEIKQCLKELIEYKYLLGNCIYEDEFGLHFLVPASFSETNKDEIKESIHKIFNEKPIEGSNYELNLTETLKGIIVPHVFITKEDALLSRLLSQALRRMKKERETGFKPEWINDWNGHVHEKRLVCSICGKRAFYEGNADVMCRSCKDLRTKGRKGEADETDKQSIFIDEIAWNGIDYENIAFFVLSFDSKHWMSGENIRTLFLNAAIREENLAKIRGNIIDIIKRKVGPLIQNEISLSEWDVNDIENEIANELENYRIMGNKTQISRDIIDGIKDKPADQIYGGLSQIVEKVLGQYKFLVPESNAYCKNPSPSRVMRVWDSTKSFFEGLDETICGESYEIKRYNLDVGSLYTTPSDTKAYELTIRSNLEEIDAEGFFDSTGIHIVTPHAVHFIENNREFEVEITDETWALQTRIYTCTSNNSYTTFRAYRSISISPDMFMFLVSASKTSYILEEIKKEYMKVFGKVYGKLPLNINIIYFKRKMPFYTVLDSARRFLDHKETDKDTNGNEDLTIEVKGDPEIDDFVKIETDIGFISIPIKLGNGKRDYYYPHLFVEDGQDAIQIESHREKHATLLKSGDKLKIHPSFFDFAFLDSNTRRFDISTENKKRPHPIFTYGPRPFYMEDIDSFSKIWSILEKSCTTTQLSNFESLLLSRIDEWRLNDLGKLKKNEEFKKLAEASIKNILSIKRKDSSDKDNPDFTVIFDSVMSGKFFDVKELYHTILKRKLGGGNNE